MDVRSVCLGILTLGEASGYEIKKMIEEGAFSYCVEASYGSIYPALARMTEEGLVECRQESQDGKPDKKIYSITDKGAELFRKELLKKPDQDRSKSDFWFILLFNEFLPDGHTSALIDERLDFLKSEIKETQNDPIGTSISPGARFMAGFRAEILETSIRYIEKNRHLLETDYNTDVVKPSLSKKVASK